MEDSAQVEVKATLERGLTDHFKSWLNANGYERHDFDRSDLKGGAYGGKSSDDEVLKHKPIIYIHGNSDIAVGLGIEEPLQVGFTKGFEYFLSQGYTKAELYATTWGEGDKEKLLSNTHSQQKLTHVYKFIEAVIKYTGSKQVDIIGHSMGTTMGRRAVIGGQVNAAEVPYNLGESLAPYVDTFIGIAGANYGLLVFLKEELKIYACGNNIDGFYPGDPVTSEGLSQILKESNDSEIKPGKHVYAIFSKKDEALFEGDEDFFMKTSKFPHLDGFKMHESDGWGHSAMRDDMGPLLLSLVTKQEFIDLPDKVKPADP